MRGLKKRFQETDPLCSVVQVLVSTIPLFALLVYFLVEAFFRSLDAPYQGEPFEEGVYSWNIRLIDMIISYMIAAFLWTWMAVYMSFFIPRRHSLVYKYLREGIPVLGDVFYKGKACCTLRHFGRLIYQHPEMDVYPVHITRTARVFERYTREKTTILVLPGAAYSGLAKDDVEVDQMVIEKNRGKIRFLRRFAIGWVVFTYLAPIYIVYVMTKSPEEIDDEIQAGYLLLFGTWVATPILAFLLTWIGWMRYRNYVMKGDGRLFTREMAEAGWFVGEDCEAPNTSNYTSAEEFAERTGSREVETLVNEDKSKRRWFPRLKGRGRKASEPDLDNAMTSMSAPSSEASRSLTASPTGESSYQLM